MLIPIALALASVSPSSSDSPLSLGLLSEAAVANLAESHSEVKQAGFGYTYIEAGGSRFDVDNLADDVDTYFGRVSLNLLGFLNLLVGYENQSTDFQDTSTDLISLGAGVHFNVTPTVDVLGEVLFLYSDVQANNLDDTSNGFEILAGARWMPLTWGGGGLELHGGALWLDLDGGVAGDGSATGFQAGARAHLLNFLGLGLAYETIEDADRILASVRFTL